MTSELLVDADLKDYSRTFQNPPPHCRLKSPRGLPLVDALFPLSTRTLRSDSSDIVLWGALSRSGGGGCVGCPLARGPRGRPEGWGRGTSKDTFPVWEGGPLVTPATISALQVGEIFSQKTLHRNEGVHTDTASKLLDVGYGWGKGNQGACRVVGDRAWSHRPQKLWTT